MARHGIYQKLERFLIKSFVYICEGLVLVHRHFMKPRNVGKQFRKPKYRNIMSNELTVGIIGLYTVVYVIVFFVQKSQIDQTKEINASMKSFMDIFKIDEVKKYVEMRNERVMEDASKMMMNNQKFKEMSDHLIKTTTEPIQEFYKKTINDRHIELLNVVSQVIISLEPDKREKFIKEVLPNNQQALMDMLIDHEKNKP